VTAAVLRVVTPPPPCPAPAPAGPAEGERRNLLAQVIADAIAYRTPSYCDDCSATDVCSDCAAGLDRTDDYLRLAAELGIDLDGSETGGES
jgi:hypothetical protein